MTENSSSTGVLDTAREAPEAAWTTFLNTFINPRQAFKSLARKPRWVLPVIFSLLMAVAGQIYMVQRVGARNMAEQSIAFVEQLGIDIDADQRELMVTSAMSQQRYAPLQAGIFLGIVFALLSGLFYVAVMAMGGDIRFYSMFGTMTHAFGAYLIISNILMILVLAVSPTPEEINFQNVVTANPAFLVDQNESPALYTILSSLDLTTVYLYFLITLGITIVGSGISMGMAWGICIFYWVLWVMIKLVPALLFG